MLPKFICNEFCKVARDKIFLRRFSSGKTIDLRGVYPAITTPFNQDETIAFDKLQGNIKKWQSTVPFAGYVVLGSTGEVANLSLNERIEVVKAVKRLIASSSSGKSSGHKLLIAGAGCESTAETISLVSKMAVSGADAALVVTPSYYKGRLTPEALENHFKKVADASEIPIVVYSVPANTGIDLDPEVVIRLSSHPNIIGMKDSGGDIAKIAYMVHKTRKHKFQILAGSLGFLMPAVNAGCVGGVLASGNVLGAQACELMTLIDERRQEEATLLQGKLIGPNWAVTKKFGIPGVKKAMDLCGLFGGPLRSPLLPLGQVDEKALKDIFVESGFL